MTQDNAISSAGYPYRPVAIWLLVSAAMVFIMAIIGAITRLEEAGLSITEWNVITGTLPPLSDAVWQQEFAKYQATPEFKQNHHWMALSDFKYIYFWEWLHRLWGRLIGVVFALPLAYFAIKKMLPPKMKLALVGMLFLGGFQGFLGWYMVQSGLVDRPDVSHYRLAIHLFTAVIIFSCLFWLYQRLARSHVQPVVKPTFCLLRHGFVSLGLVYITLIWGAFVAGLDAGKIYNTWPLMGGHFRAAELSGAGWLAYVDSHAGVQFIHRWLAAFTTLVTLAFAMRAQAWPVAAAMIAQFVLGIATLLSVVAVPLAALHQAGALILIAALLWTLYPLLQAYKAQAASCCSCGKDGATGCAPTISA